MPRNKDVLWEHIIQEGRKVRCKFCQEVFVGGVTRMRYHFARTKSKDIRPCKLVPDLVYEIALRGVQELESKSKRHKAIVFPKMSASSLGSSLHNRAVKADAPQACDHSPRHIHCAGRKTGKREADRAIVKCIVMSGLPFSFLRSKEFHDACAAVARAGLGYEPPSSEPACTRLLGELKDEVDMYVHSVKQTWEKSGCTLMLDSSPKGKDGSYLNLSAACPKGAVYLKSLCLVGHAMDADDIFEFVSSVIDEIGSHNVVQVILDKNPIYESVGCMIEQKYSNIFQINCAKQCINLMFKELDIHDHVPALLDGAKKVVTFIYKYPNVLNLMKIHTNGRDLKKPGGRFASDIVYLHSILKEEHALQQMISSTDWKDLPQSRSEEGVEVQNLIHEDIIWKCGKMLMHVLEPLIKVLRLVDSDGSISGYVFEAVHKAKEAIKEYVGGDSEKYMPFWKIIDGYKFLHCDIHVAASYLNPHLFHDGRVKLDSEVKVGLERVIQKMVPSNDERMKIAEELRDYHLLDPRVFGLMAIDSLHVSHPRIWWDMWGSSVPILQSLAIKILSQPCSSIACEKTWGVVETTDMSKGEQLDPMKLQDLLYVRMNMQFMKTVSKPENIDSKPIDVDKIEAFPDELKDFDIHEAGEDCSNEEDSEDEAGTQSNANGFSFTGIL